VARHLRLVPVWVRAPGGRPFWTTAALDSGCSRTLLDEGLAKRLGLTCEFSESILESVHGTKKELMALVDFEIAAPLSKYHQVKNAKTKKALRFTGPHLPWAQWVKTTEEFKDLPVSDVHYKNVRVLVGLDQEHLFLPLDSGPKVESADKLVRAYETLLGWTITGPDVFNKMAPTTEVFCPALQVAQVPCTNDLLEKPCTNVLLAQQFKRFNDIDGVGIMYENDKFTRKHKLQLQYFKDNSKKG